MTNYWKEIEARENKATLGPWIVRRQQKVFFVESYKGVVAEVYQRGAFYGEVDEDASNAAFIAHARNDIHALFTRVKELEAENRQLLEDALTCVCSSRLPVVDADRSLTEDEKKP